MLSSNITINEKKFINFDYGKSKKNHVLLLPSIILSKEKYISWELKEKSVSFSFLWYYFQVNIYKSTKDINPNIFKENYNMIVEFLKRHRMHVVDSQKMLNYLSKNQYIILLFKNINLQHEYAKIVILDLFRNLDFISEK